MPYKEVVSNWWKVNKIDDFLEGTLIGSREMVSTLPDGEHKTQQVYEILTDSGKFHNLIKNAEGQKVIDTANPVIIEKGEYYQYAKGSIDAAMRKIRVGQKVKFIFHSSIPSKNKMNFDFKLVKVYAGDMDKEYMQAMYNEVPTPESEPEEPKTDEIPFK